MGRGSSKAGGGRQAQGTAPAKSTIMDANDAFSASGGMENIRSTADFNREIDKVIRSVRATTAEEKTAVRALRDIRNASDADGLADIVDELASSDDTLSNALYSAVVGFAENKLRTMRPGWGA